MKVLLAVPAYAALAAVLLAGCAENPTQPTIVKNPDPNGGGKKPVVLSLLQSSGLDVAGFQKQVSSLDKISKVMDGAGTKDVKVSVGLQGIGGAGKAPALGGGAKGKMGGGPGIVKALLKPSAGAPLAKRGLFKRSADIIVDTSWFDSSTLASGYVSMLRLSVDDDPIQGYTLRDSTAYKVPYNDTDLSANKVLFTSSRYAYNDGTIWQFITGDGDGDGILNGTAGKAVLLVKTSLSTRGDTVSKGVNWSDHGMVTDYDSLGEGKAVSATDSTFIKGKLTTWSKSTDGDGDGYAGTSAPGTLGRLNYISWSLDSTGDQSLWYAGYGAGPDNDFNAWEDNTNLNSFSATVNPKGDTVSKSATDDVDGDGIINGHLPGKTAQVRNTYWYKAGDTTTLSVYLDDYGTHTVMDSLWQSNPISWCDTTWIAGKITYWHKVEDGDGDGHVNTAKAPAKPKILDESYQKWDDSTWARSSAAYGAGKDGDYGLWEDNEQYPSSTSTTNAKGETTAKYAYGDADGDGYYYAAGAANKVWESSLYFNQNGAKSYRDSTVKLIGDYATGDDDKVLFSSAAAVYDDGSTSSITTASKGGGESFGEKDTVVVNEKYTYTGYVPTDAEDRTGDQDSTVRQTWMILNDLADWEDDQIVWSSSKTWYRKGLDLTYSADVFTATKPFLSGQEPVAGVQEQEQRYTASAETDVNKWKQNTEFDNVKGTSSSRTVYYYVSGDSTVETGSQTSEHEGTYAKFWDDSTKNTGWYNNLTHEFKDTIVYLKAKDKEAAKDVSWGTYNAEDGTGDYWWKQFLADGDSAGPATRTVVKRLGEEKFSITTTTGSESSTYSTHGDTTFWEDNSDSVKTLYAVVGNEDGSWSMSQESKDAAGGMLMAGTFTFLPDGSGFGKLTEYKDGTAQTPVELRFEIDGTTYVNGVAVSDEPTGGSASGDGGGDAGGADGV